ncbi:MAG: hypothetical protein ACK559_21995, partial [bacterium]
IINIKGIILLTFMQCPRSIILSSNFQVWPAGQHPHPPVVNIQKNNKKRLKFLLKIRLAGQLLSSKF